MAHDPHPQGNTLYGVQADPGTQWPIQIEMNTVSIQAGTPAAGQ